MKWIYMLFSLFLLGFTGVPADEEFTIKAEVNGNVFTINDDINTISALQLKDSVRINLKVYLDDEDASSTHYIFTYEVKLKRNGKILYQMNYKRGQEYNFFPPTAKEMIAPGDLIEFNMSNFTFEDEGGIQTQMLPANMRKLTVVIN